MSWAMGPGWVTSFPAVRAAFDAGDYATAAAQSHMQGTGIDMRNMANKLLFNNAALAAAKKADPDYLYYIAGLESLTSTAGSLIARIIKSPIKLLGAVVITAGVVAGTVFAFRGRST